MDKKKVLNEIRGWIVMAVYDCCILYNEIDLLKMRMNILNSYVDYFVICELNCTFRGQEKKYYLKERINEFKNFRHKIIYVNSDNIPEWTGEKDWSIEKHQRNCFVKELLKCRDEDLILISDVDEIPNPYIISNLKDYWVSIKTGYQFNNRIRCILGMASILKKKEFFSLLKGKYTALDVLDKSPIVLKLTNHYYYMNCRADSFIFGTVICRCKNLFMPQVLRERRYNFPCIDNAGWHFSYLGGIEQIKLKLSSIIDDRPEIIDQMKRYSSEDDYIISCLSSGKDLFGRNDKTNLFHFIDIDEIGIPDIDNIQKEYNKFFYLQPK